MEKYDKIGIGYNQTRKADPYLAGRLLHHLRPEDSQWFGDIGCGTGNYTIALQGFGLNFIGIDPSDKMLDIARSRSENINWKKGTAEAIPLHDNTLDGMVASLTIHHWKQLNQGFEEVFRVLKPNGRLVIFTSTPKQMEGYWLNHYFPKMLQDSIRQMPSLDQVVSGLEKAGFHSFETEKYFIHDGLEDLFLYSGKNNPALYLNPKIRKGISSFSDLAHNTEVKNGLHQLSQDIKSKHIENILNNYENIHGDYVFITASR